MSDAESGAAIRDQILKGLDLVPVDRDCLRPLHDGIGRKARCLEPDCISLDRSLQNFRLRLRFALVLRKVHDLCGLSQFLLVQEPDLNIHRRAQGDLLAILIRDADIQQFNIAESILVAVDRRRCLFYIGVVVCVLLCELPDQELRITADPRVRAKVHSDLIGTAVRREECCRYRLRSHNSVDGELLRLELNGLDLFDLSGLRIFAFGPGLLVLGLNLSLEDFGVLLIIFVKVYRVQRRLRRDLERFFILNTNLHLTGRLDLFVFIFESNVIEFGKRQLRILIILVLHFALGLVVVLLVEFRFFFLRDLLDVEDHTHRQFGRRAKIGVDQIVLAFKNKLCVLCDQFKLFCGFAGLRGGPRCSRFIAGIFCVSGTCFFGVSRVGVFRACAFACRTFISSFVVGIFCNSIFCIGRVSVFAVIRIFAVGRAFIIGI